MSRSHRVRALTLIELLVVIFTIALLISIVMPAFSRARAQGDSLHCLTNLRALGVGFSTYAMSNEDYLCSGQSDARPGMNLPESVVDFESIGIESIGWIADLVNSAAAFPGKMLCRSNRGTITQSWSRALESPGGASWYTPQRFQALIAEGYNTNYCQSWYMIHTQYDGVTTPVSNADLMRGSIGPLHGTAMGTAGPSRVPLLGDARAPPNDRLDYSAQGYGPDRNETKSATDGPGWRVSGDAYFPAPYSAAMPYGVQDWDDFGPAHRPQGTNEEGNPFTAGNILFGDGHAETFLDQFDFDNGRVKARPDGELDSWDLREKVFDGVLSTGRRSSNARQPD